MVPRKGAVYLFLDDDEEKMRKRMRETSREMNMMREKRMKKTGRMRRTR